MTKEIYYEYLGTNGTVLTPVHLEDIYYVRKLKITADDFKLLTNGKQTIKTIIIPEEELNLW